MKTPYAIALVGIVSAACVAPDVCGQLISETHHFTGPPLPLTPPDISPTPVSDTRTIISAIGSISDVNVSFTLANALQGGAFNGDYYMTLQHESGFSVLLNRVGRRANSGTVGETLGYADNGFNVTLDDQAVNGDIHVYRQTLSGSHTTAVDPLFIQPLTGTWAPDGRTNAPTGVLASMPRPAQLHVFNDLPASGAWTLQVIDFNSGGVAALSDWSITISGAAVPEPAETAAMAGGALLAFAALRRRWRKNAGSR